MGLDFGVAMISCCYLQAGYVGEDVESILYKLLMVILTSLLYLYAI
jgi:ATP-dependent protease Clp ATPase subunit